MNERQSPRIPDHDCNDDRPALAFRREPSRPSSDAPTRQLGITLEDGVSSETRRCLDDFLRAATTAEWCAQQCIREDGMYHCVRLCRDVSDLARSNVTFIGRNSTFTPELAELFVAAAETCAEACSAHPHEYCQDCASTLEEAIDSTRSMLDARSTRRRR